MSNAPTCPSCGTALYPDDRFCVGCGVPAAVPQVPDGGTRALVALRTGLLDAVRPCSRCGQAVYPDDQHCATCGAGQGAGESGPAGASGTATATGLACRACGTGLYPDDNFCIGCGAPTRERPVAVPASGGTRVLAAVGRAVDGPPATCPRCRVATLPQHRFCQHCGLPLAAEAAAERSAPRPGAAAPAEVVLARPADDPWARIRQRLDQAFLGELDIAQELGRGGMAAVFLAHDLALDRKVAVKVMAPGLLTGAGMVERFKREAKTVAGLRHPHIVSIYAVRHSEDLHCIVMAFVDGNSLEQVLRAGGPMPIEIVRAILFQVGSGLAYAHRRGVVHRDLKPANILLDSDGNAVIMDFGIAKVAEQPSQTQTGAAVGTPAYMSPEQCYAADVTWASDQYSLGVVAYEMLTGRKPFDGPAFQVMQAHTQTPPPPLRAARPDCPPEMEAAVLRMMAKDPARRFPSLAEALEAMGARPLAPGDPLHAALSKLATARTAEIAALPVTPASPIPGTQAAAPRRGSGGRRAVLLGALGLAAVAVVAAAVLVRGGAAPVVEPVAGTAVDAAAGGPPADPPNDPVAGEGRVDPPTPAIPAGAVELSAPKRVLDLAETAQLSAAVTDSTGARVANPPIQWRSSDPTRVEVSAQGLVTARQPGRARITATSGAWTGILDLTVRLPRLTRLVLSAPAGPFTVGRSVEVAALAEWERPGLANPALTWRSSNPAVATIAGSDSLRAQVSLLGEGEATISAEAGGVAGTTTLAVRPATTLEVGRTAVSFEAPSEGAPPPDQTVTVTAAGGQQPAVQAPEYLGGAPGWLTALLQGSTLTLRASPRGIPAGSHRAQVAVTAGSLTRTVTVDFRVTTPVVTDPVAAARPAIEALLDRYQRALNSGDAEGVTRAFPSIPRRDLDALMSRRVSDRVEILLRSGSLRAGAEPGTIEGEVTSGMLGERAGRIARFTFVFARSGSDWIIQGTRELR